MSRTGYQAEIDRRYGAAGKFVKRALDAYRNMVGFHNPTPNQCIHRLLSHLERIQSMGDKFLTDEQRERANETVFALMEGAQEYDAAYEGCDISEEIPSGDAERVNRLHGWSHTGLSARQGVHDSREDPVLRHARPELQDERVSYLDPAIALSRYVIRAGECLQTYLTLDQDMQFELIEQQWIMDNLRRLEDRLVFRQGARKSPRVAPREGGLCCVGGE